MGQGCHIFLDKDMRACILSSFAAENVKQARAVISLEIKLFNVRITVCIYESRDGAYTKTGINHQHFCVEGIDISDAFQGSQSLKMINQVGNVAFGHRNHCLVFQRVPG